MEGGYGAAMFERFTERARQVVVLAQEEARALKHNYIGTEHILLGLVRENEGVAARVLLDFDADAEKIRNEIIRMLSGPGRREASGRGGVVRAFAQDNEPVTPMSDDLSWEYSVRTIVGPSDTWAQQLSSWRREGELSSNDAFRDEREAAGRASRVHRPLTCPRRTS
jgi:ATP-dependent Clp protease ATP-binding subunit ClpA